MERNCKRKNKTKKVIFSPDWLYQLGLEVPALGLGLEAPLAPVGIRTGTKCLPFNPGWQARD
jgi:hypothetical protein